MYINPAYVNYFQIIVANMEIVKIYYKILYSEVCKNFCGHFFKTLYDIDI